jgi:hypothetical protein
VLWAPGSDPQGGPFDDSIYVPRLRIYPHAMQQANAFYSPSLKALLFGYFPATGTAPTRQYPGGITYTCLSHDIVAHETTHAVLDGMHRRFNAPTNPDMLAFHEAFADIVALFQHFTFSEVVRHQIISTRNDMSAAQLLGDMARGFGVATGRERALRSAIGMPPDPAAYHTVLEPHQRGALLVATIFDAFVAIYNRRTVDLLRIASEGTGVIRPGRLQSDLVNRLADEAAHTARQFLDMCIRALDYCPPVDLTFGDYLRAMVTADYEHVPDDFLGYRVALLQSFRQRGIFPLDVPNLSVESLRWQPAIEPNASPAVMLLVEILRQYAEKCSYIDSRRQLFDETRQTRRHLNQLIVEILRTGEDPDGFARTFGLEVGNGDPSVEVHALRIAQRIKPNRAEQAQAIIELTQTRSMPLDEAAPEQGSFEFAGGSTLVVDLKKPALQYVVVKDMRSRTRIQRTREYLRHRGLTGLGRPALEEPFALLHGGMMSQDSWGS